MLGSLVGPGAVRGRRPLADVLGVILQVLCATAVTVSGDS